MPRGPRSVLMQRAPVGCGAAGAGAGAGRGSQTGSVPERRRQIGSALLQLSGGGPAPPALPPQPAPSGLPSDGAAPRSLAGPGPARSAPWTHSLGGAEEGRSSPDSPVRDSPPPR